MIYVDSKADVSINMRLSWLCSIFLVVALVVVSGQDELPLAEPCDADSCVLPDCRCSDTNIPEEIEPRDTPQFVTLTFDNAVLPTNIDTYRQLLYDRNNSNGCKIGTTFYVSHVYTNYQFVNELYNQGFEIGLNSISHVADLSYWAAGTYENMEQEFVDQKVLMSHFANIPAGEMKGIRVPFLQNTGNASYHVMKDHGIEYDSSWPTIEFRDPGLWPYTLDFASTQDCPNFPCPTASLPGVWVNPLISWADLLGFPCFHVNSCIFVPAQTDEDAWFQYILENFERHYLGSRAPFGFYIQEWYLSSFPAVYRALDRFIELITRLPDVFLVNEIDVIEWSKNPVPVNEYQIQECRTFQSTSCPSINTCELTAAHNNVTYWLTGCVTCPSVYPWLGNPLGLPEEEASSEI